VKHGVIKIVNHWPQGPDRRGPGVRQDRVRIAVLSPLLAGAYYGQVLKGIARQTAALGGRVVAIQTRDGRLDGRYPWLPARAGSRLAWEQADAFITVLDAADESYLEAIRAEGKPVVMISYQLPGFKCPQVMPDNRSGVSEAVAHLISHGHSRIAFAGNLVRGRSDDISERYEAYKETLSKHGLEPDPKLVFVGPEDGGEAIAGAMLRAGLPCTAVVVATDLIASGMISALHEAGVNLPSQLAMVGFDDRDFASRVSPPLATVRQDFGRLGEIAAQLVIEMVNGEDVPAGEYMAKTTFVPRESCGCPAPVLLQRPSAPGESAGQRLCRDLTAQLAGSNATPRQVLVIAQFADEVARFCHHLSESLSPNSTSLRQAADSVYRAVPRGATVHTVMECVQQYRRDLLSQSGYTEERLMALDRCAFEVSTTVNGALARSQGVLISSLEESLRDEHYVSLELVGMGRDGAGPKSLAWLKGTHVKSACFAVWGEGADESGPEPLRVAGVFGAGMAERLPIGSTLGIADFPPVASLVAEGSEPDDLVLVLPVRTPARHWGVLAVSGQVEAATQTGGDIYFQWTAMLGLALDHDALVEGTRASEERYALAARAANDGLWDWDVPSGTVFYSPRWKAMLGYAEDEVGSTTSEWFSRVHPEDSDELKDMVDRQLFGDEGALEFEHRLIAKDGNYRWGLCRAVAVRGPGGRAVRLVGSLTDITERKELESRLRQAALYDSLTGLPNRLLFMDRLEQAFARVKRSPEYQFCILFMDLDGFKSVNDNYGHAFGDLLLVAVAERISAHLRGNDTAVRFGGDEFAVLVDSVKSMEHVHTIAKRLQAKLSAPYGIDGHEVSVSATIGIASSTTGYQTREDMIRDADAAMYRAKPGERGSPVNFAKPKLDTAEATVAM
jgi:diguanylate cyclase (GGDEF)-like protein/PAS domain S-box-containing protein